MGRDDEVGRKVDDEVGRKVDDEVGRKVDDEVEVSTIAILFSVIVSVSGSFALRKSTLSFFMTQLSSSAVLVTSIKSDLSEYAALDINLYFS